jgi:putative DNA primase/helicase
MIAALRYDDDLASVRRVVTQAPPEKRMAAFTSMSSEFVRWFDVGEFRKPDVLDALRNVGLEAGLSEDDIQTALANAIEAPFHPRPPTNSRGADRRSPAASPASLVISCAADIVPEPIRWLWRPRIAIGKQTMLAGEPGLGKSQLTCWIAAAVTTGGLWPDNHEAAPKGSVIILSAEDDAADTIRPRLDAAGADPNKVYVISAVRGENGKGRRSFNLQADLALLEAEIAKIGDVYLVIVDPVSSYLGKVDSHRNAELRAVLEPIGEMASRLGVAVLSITHLSKGGGGSANSRIIGSIAFVAQARAAFIVARDPDDHERRLFLPTKNNLGPEGTGLGFRIGQVVTPTGLLAPSIFWDDLPVTISANEALAPSTETATAPARNEAEDFLQQVLADGPRPTVQIRAEANSAGVAWPTVRRAKEKLGVKASKVTLDGGWEWAMPRDAATEGAHFS